MAVYTDLKKEEITTFLSLYNIGKLVSFYGITEGIENSNYHLKTTNGDFILTLFEKRTHKRDLPFFINIMLYLNDRKFCQCLPYLMVCKLCYFYGHDCEDLFINKAVSHQRHRRKESIPTVRCPLE